MITSEFYPEQCAQRKIKMKKKDKAEHYKDDFDIINANSWFKKRFNTGTIFTIYIFFP